MPRSSLAVALAVVLVVLFSTINLVHHIGPAGFETWRWIWGSRSIKCRDLNATAATGQQYLLGVGKADITGPVVEINFMGYANTSQVGTGLRQRIYSRAFIIGDVESPQDRFIYLVLDTQSGDTAIRHGILDTLAGIGDDYSMYGQQNVAVTGTHAHSGPGAWLNYLLPQITSKGFDKDSYQAIVDGAVKSIQIAHRNLKPGHLSIGTTEIDDANASRSPYAYIQNPQEERDRYSANVDKTMTLLRFTHTLDSGEKDIGILNWFAVHGTSMLGNNTIVTGDNKGVAALMFEKSMDDPTFVAGFSQANVGDTTPNINGAYCESGEQEGQMCDFKTSLCDGSSQPCHGRGPYYGRNDYGTASCYEIGTRQFEGARSLYDDSSAFTPVTGGAIKSLHQFVDFSAYHFQLQNGTMAKTCPAALGYSFAAGTTDGPGAFDFKQGKPGDPGANPVWAVVSDLLHAPNDTQKECQGVKPILLDVGETHQPYDWAPNIVNVQILRVGQFFIVVSPGEATTMSGRRWREAVQSSAADTFDDLNGTNPVVVLGAPANSYTHYIATPEEYSVQRYEGASTLFGPNTLDAYINRSVTLLPYLDTKATNLPPLDPGPSPTINIDKALDFITGVIVDNPPILKAFGDQTTGPKATYKLGDIISVAFVGANPRNNFRLGKTFALVEQFDFDSKTWRMIRNDNDWSLLYQWERTSTVLGTSQVTISWETKWETDAWKSDSSVPGSTKDDLKTRQSQLSGLFRIKYHGDSKAIGGKISPFLGISDEFRIQ